MYCKTCRQPLPHDARRCPNCGAPIENTVLQSGARDFTADYDPRDIQENRGWGILSYLGFLVLIPIFAARNSYFARFHANQGLVLFLFYACYSVLTRIITNILNLALGFIPFVPGMISAALQFIGIIFFVLMILGIANAASGQSKGAAVHRPYSPFEITVHSKIALRDFLSRVFLYANFAKPLRTKSIYAILRKEKFSVRRILIKRQRGGAPDLPCRTAFT